MLCYWRLRPSALLKYEDANRADLFSCYQHDQQVYQHSCHNTAGSDCCPCERQTLKRQPDCKLRTCQWNVNYLCHAMDYVTDRTAAGAEVARVLLQTDSDVMVLNEFGTNRWIHGDSGMRALRELLEGAGYRLHAAKCSFPTAVATRLPIVQEPQNVYLDQMRSAVDVHVKLPMERLSASWERIWKTAMIGMGNTDDSKWKLFWITCKPVKRAISK